MKTSNSTARLVSVASALALAALPRIAFSQAAAGSGAEPARLADTVKSRDGTSIAFEKLGKGPVLIIVACALADRSGASPLASLLAPHFTVLNYDRRGRGGTGDKAPYSVEREIEDIEALVDKVGGSAFLFGSSSGAVLALEAANKLTSKVTAVALFEPPFIVDDSRPPIPDGFFKEVASHVAAGRRGDAVALFMTRGIGVPEEMVAQMKQAPMWAGMEKLAHTIPYDGALLAGLQGGKPLPKKRWTSISARTLVFDGENSPAFLRNSTRALVEVLPRSKHLTLEGQDHSAVFTAPQALVPLLTGFFGGAAEAAAAGAQRAATSGQK